MRAVVLIVVLAVIAIAVLARSNGHSTVATRASAGKSALSTTPPTTAPATTTPTTVVPADQVKLQVLNGVLTGSLAGEWSNKLRANPGYQTLPPDNATAKVTSSAIYILTPGYQPEADALASVVGLPTSAINPTVPAPSSAPIPASERATANLVLVIGPDLAASA